MNMNRLTENAQEAMLAAQQLAANGGNPQVEPEHLLVTLIEQPKGIVSALLRKLDIDPQVVAKAARTEICTFSVCLRRCATCPAITPPVKLSGNSHPNCT